MTKSASDVLVRPVAPADRQTWERLFLDYGVFYEEDFPRSVIDGVWQWLMDSAHPVRCFVAEMKGAVVGFAHLRHQHDTFTAGPGWFLDDLFTSPEARGRGAATALINAANEYALAHGGGTLRWITAHDNDRARRLYDTLATPTTWVTYEKEVE
ncbi:MAG: GNAT family N-acetyltransferase [Microbacteriaceae bacterium]|jgi:GNAT superfamily N-acetyltransferase|nr:GNAT family N-acetyltransferase [Microbacteriaceae bacterium]